MRRNGYLWTFGVNSYTAVRIPDPDCFVRVQSFGELATFSVDFCILYAEYPPYLYFRFVWPTDLESIPHALTPTSIIPTKFEVDMTIHCRVITFLSADTSRDFVTSTFDLLTLKSCHAWPVTWSTLPPSLKTLWLFVHELRVVTVFIDYHFDVCGHCACAESRDSWAEFKNNYIFGIPGHDLPIYCTTFIGLRRQLRVICSRAV